MRRLIIAISFLTTIGIGTVSYGGVSPRGVADDSAAQMICVCNQRACDCTLVGRDGAGNLVF
jgi:hypothetical protein